ncbi:hypothetical protein, partial [Chryseobacterium luquanense]
YIYLITLISFGNLFYSQKLDSIEFTSSNSIIIGSKINVKFQPLKNNKKGKVKVMVKNKENYFTRRISGNDYRNISQYILNIKEPIYILGQDSIRTTCLDGSFTTITAFKDNIKKQYHMDCISYKDKDNNEKKDFWNAARLIMEKMKMKIENLY